MRYAWQALRQSSGEGTSQVPWRWLVRALLAREAVATKCVGEARQDHEANRIVFCRISINSGMSLSNDIW